MPALHILHFLRLMCIEVFEIYLKALAKDGASLVAQLVKNPPAMQETLVRFLGWEDPPKKG